MQGMYDVVNMYEKAHHKTCIQFSQTAQSRNMKVFVTDASLPFGNNTSYDNNKNCTHSQPSSAYPSLDIHRDDRCKEAMAKTTRCMC